MRFDKVTKTQFPNHVEQAWKNFLNEFKPIGINTSSASQVKATYLVRLLQPEKFLQISESYSSKNRTRALSGSGPLYFVFRFDGYLLLNFQSIYRTD